MINPHVLSLDCDISQCRRDDVCIAQRIPFLRPQESDNLHSRSLAGGNPNARILDDNAVIRCDAKAGGPQRGNYQAPVSRAAHRWPSRKHRE